MSSRGRQRRPGPALQFGFRAPSSLWQVLERDGTPRATHSRQLQQHTPHLQPCSRASALQASRRSRVQTPLHALGAPQIEAHVQRDVPFRRVCPRAHLPPRPHLPVSGTRPRALACEQGACGGARPRAAVLGKKIGGGWGLGLGCVWWRWGRPGRSRRRGRWCRRCPWGRRRWRRRGCSWHSPTHPRPH